MWGVVETSHGLYENHNPNKTKKYMKITYQYRTNQNQMFTQQSISYYSRTMTQRNPQVDHFTNFNLYEDADPVEFDKPGIINCCQNRL